MKVYQAQLQDVDKIVPLYVQYREFYHVVPSPDDAAIFLKQRIQQHESVIFFVENEQGEPVGFTQLYPLYCSLEMKRIWLLYDLFVVPQARKQGVAQVLLDRAKQLGEETGSAFLMLSTATDNFQAQALYEKNGYQRDTQFYGYIKPLSE